MNEDSPEDWRRVPEKEVGKVRRYYTDRDVSSFPLPDLTPKGFVPVGTLRYRLVASLILTWATCMWLVLAAIYQSAWPLFGALPCASTAFFAARHVYRYLPESDQW